MTAAGPTDWRGLPISGADRSTAEGVDRFERAFLDFSDDVDGIMALAEATPGCATTQLYAAAMHLYSQTDAEIATAARPLLERAAALGGRANERERLLLAALDAWARADYGESASAFEALLGRWPRDVTSVKFAEFVFFESPDYERHLRLMDSVAAANAELAPFRAMHAFAQELNGRYREAEATAESALRIDPDTPWADHALGHIWLNTGRIELGRSALQAASARWPAHSVGIGAHNAWHLALLHLASLDVDGALALHRAWFDGRDPGSAFEHTDAISLLWRVELCGIGLPGSAWEPFVPAARQRVADRVMPFLNAHYAYALARAGLAGEARRGIETLVARVDGSRDPWRTGIALLRGVVALADGDPARAAADLGPVRATLACVGGSDAQNDLFAQSLLVATARSGQHRRARELLTDRLGDRAPTAQEESWLAGR